MWRRSRRFSSYGLRPSPGWHASCFLHVSHVLAQNAVSHRYGRLRWEPSIDVLQASVRRFRGVPCPGSRVCPSVAADPVGFADCDPARLDLLFKHSNSDRIGAAGTDGAIMSARQHEVIEVALGIQTSEHWSRRLSLKVWAIWALITRLASAVRDFASPRYRPELHYMRGPGPACARGVSTRSRRPAG